MNPLHPESFAAVPPGFEFAPRHLPVHRTFQGIPGLTITPGGRLWATWYAGGHDEGPANYVTLARSDDGGQTWLDPVLVVDPPGNVRAYDSVVWLDPLGRLWLFWAQCYTPSDRIITDGIAGVWAICAGEPDAASPAWSAPRRIANGVMMNKPVVLANGNWAYPTAVWRAGIGGHTPPPALAAGAECFSNLTVSTDQGRTYARRGGADVPDRVFDEHQIVELRDGRLWMLVRTAYGIGQSYSSDGGCTWSPGAPSAIPGPGSRFFIRRLQSGRLLLVNHQVDPARPAIRLKLTAWLSADDGQSWQGGLLLDERESVSYPDGVQDRSGTVWIIYDHERYRAGEILFAAFREEDVLAGHPVTPACRLRQPISRTAGVPVVAH